MIGFSFLGLSYLGLFSLGLISLSREKYNSETWLSCAKGKICHSSDDDRLLIFFLAGSLGATGTASTASTAEWRENV